MHHPGFSSLLRLALAGAIAAWLAGCASVAPPGAQASQPADLGKPPAQEQAATGGAAPSAIPSAVAQPADTSAPLPAAPGEPGSEAAGATAPPPPVSSNRAVVALVERARQEAGSGRRESAGASLERALRIEPRNAWLWHELARLRLTQGQYAQAVSLAQKSNSLAVRERSLRALNWHLIADARIAQGDSGGAAHARKLAEDLQRP
jgi:predicted Zn-dependent protease